MLLEVYKLTRTVLITNPVKGDFQPDSMAFTDPSRA